MSNVKFEKKVFVREKASPFRKGRCFRNSSYLDEGPSIPSIELRTDSLRIQSLIPQIRDDIFSRLCSAPPAADFQHGEQAPAFSIGSRIKVCYGKFFMVFLSRFIIRFCGLDFIVEKSNGFAFVVVAYPDVPLLCVLVPGYSLVF